MFRSEEKAVVDEAKRVIEHYGLEGIAARVVLRFSYPWVTKHKPQIRTLSVTMIPDKVSIPEPHFQIRRRARRWHTATVAKSTL